MEDVVRDVYFVYCESFYGKLYMIIGCGFLDIVGREVVW